MFFYWEDDMDAIVKTMGATTATVQPVVSNIENKVKNSLSTPLEAKPKDEAPSSQVNLSPKAQSIQATGLTSVQFDADPESGKAVVSVISKDDNTVIRQIRSPISVTQVKQLDAQPAAAQSINTTA
ncbi:MULTISPECIES: flagellar protein FlaG [unclassified Polynucleobacter]|uniref:flagellar protein FlaG n=1 Tax=unclassified Polynucleobacter TaxID=2640945 RepID=UPI002493C089|nr:MULTISPECIES: flagellar protein FlaG [unclassified Polynucleobacter]